MDSEFVILKLDSQQAALHKEIYKTHIQRLTDEIGGMYEILRKKESELESYKNLLSSLAGLRPPLPKAVLGKISGIQTPIANGEYQKDLSLAKKCEFILKHSPRLLSIRNIAEGILRHEPDLIKTKEITFDQFLKNLSSTLLQKVAKGDTFFRENGSGEYRYGLINEKQEYVK